MFRRLFTRLVLLTMVLVTRTAFAAPGDAAAEKKINEAVNQHYFNTNFDQAEAVLMSAVQACGTKCSATVLGRLWMYVGLVRINGKEDRAGAVTAFSSALAVDPSVALDESLVTPAATAALTEARGKGGKPGKQGKQGAGAAGADTEGATAPPAGPLACTPEPRDVGLGEPIPISCTTDKPAVSGTVYFMEPEGSEFVPVALRMNEGALQGIIPCRGVAREGTVRVYVEVRDAQAKVIERVGSKTRPLEFTVVKKSGLSAPTFPGQPPPAHCKASELKKSVRGTRDWGDSCRADSECKSALCVNGSCDSCNADKDCPSGTCNNGACAMVEAPEGEGEGAEETESKPSGTAKKNWVGLHGALDVVPVGGDNVCTRTSQDTAGYACFYQGYGTQYIYDPYPIYGGKVPGNAAIGSKRILASYDRLLGSRFTIGARLGYAMGDQAPTALTGVAFSPLHLELRLAVWFGKDPFAGSGLRPYVHVGAGMATIHVKSEVPIYDCQGGSSMYGKSKPDTYDACKVGSVPYNQSGAAIVTLDAFRTMGSTFLTAGGGLVYAFTPAFGLQLNVNLMLFMGVSGFSLEPSLGPVVGF